jgi:heme oxygenase
LSVVQPAEQRLARWLSPEPPPLYEPERRTQWLLSDLGALAASDSAPSADSAHSVPSAEFDFINSLPAAIGAQYVLEGSSLGGQFLSRQLQRNLSISPASGGAYFAAYGSETMKRWKAFGQWANARLADAARSNPNSIDQATDAAVLMFARFQSALGGAEA